MKLEEYNSEDEKELHPADRTRLQIARRRNQQEKFSEKQRDEWKSDFIRDNLHDFCLFISSCPVIDMGFRMDYVECRDGNKGFRNPCMCPFHRDFKPLKDNFFHQIKDTYGKKLF